jgi:excisionase family DNA binding protein
LAQRVSTASEPAHGQEVRMTELWLTTAEVAERLRVTEDTVRRWIRNGDLPVLNLGGSRAGYRIREADLDAFIAERYGPLGKDAA